MYDGKTQLLIANPINRYLINSPMLPAMKKNPDGGVTIYVSRDNPGPDKAANWLPAPTGQSTWSCGSTGPRPRARTGHGSRRPSSQRADPAIGRGTWYSVSLTAKASRSTRHGDNDQTPPSRARPGHARRPAAAGRDPDGSKGPRQDPAHARDPRVARRLADAGQTRRSHRHPARRRQEPAKALVPLRYGRMLASPFTFYRGSAGVMAADLATTPSTGVKVQACGDAHLMNFGGFATPERRIIFDINDLDETLPAPWEWDLKRLAASFVLAARANGLSTMTAGMRP